MDNSNIGLQLLKYTEGGLRLLLVFHIVHLFRSFSHHTLPPLLFFFLSNLVSCETKAVDQNANKAQE